MLFFFYLPLMQSKLCSIDKHRKPFLTKRISHRLGLVYFCKISFQCLHIVFKFIIGCHPEGGTTEGS
jgi:hypothetical protein